MRKDDLFMKLRINENAGNAPTLEEVTNVCRRYGYIVEPESCLVQSGSLITLQLYINPNKDENRYYPPIYTKTGRPGNVGLVKNIREVKFIVGTASFGSLEADEYSQFVDACNNAYEVVKYLQSIDFSNFPIESLD